MTSYLVTFVMFGETSTYKVTAPDEATALFAAGAVTGGDRNLDEWDVHTMIASGGLTASVVAV